MLEIMIWKDPFPKSEYKFSWNIAESTVHGKRPKCIEKLKNIHIKQLIETCWIQNPKDRLTINDIVTLLQTQLSKK